MVIDSNIYSSCFVISKTKPPLTKKGGGAEKLYGTVTLIRPGAYIVHSS